MARSEEDIAFDQRMGQRLRLFREQCGLTRQELAEKVGHPATSQLIHDYEFGTTSIPACHIDCLSLAVRAASYLLLDDTPFANASDWIFFERYRSLDRNTRLQLRKAVVGLACNAIVLD